jgi:hypothetical protein
VDFTRNSVATLGTCDSSQVIATLIRMNGSGLLVLAPAHEIFRQCQEALDIALELTPILERLLQLVKKIGWTEIKASTGPITKANQLFVSDIGQIDHAVVKPVFGKPTSPVLDLNVVSILGFLIRGRPRIDHDWKELGCVRLQLLGERQRFLHATRCFIQIAHHETTVHHDSRLAAAPDEAMCLLVILCVSAVVVVLFHAMNYFYIAALKADAE